MTLREIAELAGVSPSAVSRYLNGGSLSKEKYDTIHRVIQETGYVPNQVAHNLRTGRVNQVLVLVPKIHSMSVTQVVAGITETLGEQGYLPVMATLEHAENIVEAETQYLEMAKSYNMAGVIVMASTDAGARKHIFENCGLPLVVTGQHFRDINCVYHDDFQAAKDLTELLIARGRKNICIISGPKSDPAIGVNRVAGVTAALQEAGLLGPGKQPRLEYSEFHMKKGKDAMKRALEKWPEIDGVFCATDSMGHGAMMALKEAGKNIPRDVSVVAFGNDWANLVSDPQLTTAELYQTQCGRDAATILLELLKEESDPEFHRQIMLGYKIQERESV